MADVFFRSESLNKLSARLASVNILIADGDPNIASLLKDIVTQIGFRNVQVVHDGEQAQRIMQETQVDLIITDWAMERVDGIEFVKKLRAHTESSYRRVPIIMLTGKGEKADVEIARDAGINEFIVKPFHPKTLLDRLVMLVEHPRNFVMTRQFKGPDRRRRSANDGEERRANSIDPKSFVSRSEEQSVETGAQTLLLAPDYQLKRKIGEDVNIRDILLPEVLRNVQEVIDRRQPLFLEWVAEDFTRLEQAYQSSAKGQAQAERENVRHLAFGIKSQAGIFKYSLASTVARLLYNFCEEARIFDENYLLVVKQHVDALRGIFQLSIEGDGGQMGRELQDSLIKLANKYRAIHGLA